MGKSAFLQGVFHRAPGLFEVFAVGKAAASDVSGNIGHREKNIVECQVSKAKLLKARRVNDKAFGAVKIIKSGDCGGLTAKIERLRVFLGFGVGVFD